MLRQQWVNLGDVDGRQSAQNLGEVFLRVDRATAATDDEGVDHSTAPTGVGMPDEEPAAAANGGNADRVFDEIMLPPDLCRVAA